MQETYMDSIDSSEAELEETLSFCDLATHDDAEWEDLSYNSSSQSSRMQHDYDFEFFREEWGSNTSATSTCTPPNIIFCGEPIHSKKEIKGCDSQSRLDIFNRKKGLSRWDTLDSSIKEIYGHKKNRKQRYYTLKNDSSVQQKMPTILTSPSKSRWYMLFLGAARIPTGGSMELRDIKSRQSRQSPSSSPLFQFKGDGDHQGVVDLNRKRSKTSWGLIRALGCGGYHQATTIQASIKSIPRV